MIPNTATSGSDALAQVLQHLNHEGKFSISILTDEQGLAIASACENGFDPDRQAAVAALVQRAIGQAGLRLGMAQIDEMIFYTTENERLVCRFFNAQGHSLILAVTIIGKEQTYRRLMKQTITQVREVWVKYWE